MKYGLMNQLKSLMYYLFVLNKIIIIDPKEDKIIENMPNYEMAKDWLCEDEYTLVNGRMKVDNF